MKAINFLLLLFALQCNICFAQVRLPKLLASNMVLQREKPINIWGWASVGEKVTVTFHQQTKSIKADKSGKWMISLASENAGGPYTMIIKGKNTITLDNILVGEVWVCSGQSNMEWHVREAKDAANEIQNANYPHIRQFEVRKSISLKPQEDVKDGDWKICSPQTAGGFTAVGYFFAREVYEKTKIPIGIINTSWGATQSETWTSREAFENSDEFKAMISQLPNIDLEQAARQSKEKLSQRLEGIGLRVPDPKEVSHWMEPDFNDVAWPSMKIPQGWEKVIGEVDGVIWFRKEFQISKDDASKAATLELSTIDDNDETFVNGVKIGATNAWNVKRAYLIPPSILKEGKNSVAVRIVDTGGGGGIYGEEKDIRVITQSQQVISLVGDWHFMVESLQDGTISPNSYPTLLFNAMLNPLLNYGIRGALWYQGEANAVRAFQYRKAFPLMIQDWRNHFKQGEFPFYFVQLSSYNENNGNSQKGSTWAELREAQTMTLSLANTGMAVTTDIGEANDIHPRNKQDVGKRLAAMALNRIYKINQVDGGPTFQSMKVEGNKVRISFTQTGTGLLVKDKYGYLKGFEVAGSDQKFYFAKAWTEGNDVIVSCDAVTQPVAVRFAWADNPEDANLFNNEGFPAVPFRTDTWKGITDEKKFSFD